MGVRCLITAGHIVLGMQAALGRPFACLSPAALGCLIPGFSICSRLGHCQISRFFFWLQIPHLGCLDQCDTYRPSVPASRLSESTQDYTSSSLGAKHMNVARNSKEKVSRKLRASFLGPLLPCPRRLELQHYRQRRLLQSEAPIQTDMEQSPPAMTQQTMILIKK